MLKLLLHVGIQGGEDKVLGGRATDRILPRVAWDFPVCLTSAAIAFTAMPGASPTTTNGAYGEGCALTTEPLSIGGNFPVESIASARHTAENSIAASVTKATWHMTNIKPALASANSIASKVLH